MKGQKRKGGKFTVDPNSKRQQKLRAKKRPVHPRQPAPVEVPTAPVFTATPDGAPTVPPVDSTASDAVPGDTDGAASTAAGTVPDDSQAVEEDGDTLGYFDPGSDEVDDQVPQPTDDGDVDSGGPAPKKGKDGKAGTVYMKPADAGEMIMEMVAGVWITYLQLRHPYVLALKPEQQALFAMTEQDCDRIKKAGTLYAKHNPIPLDPTTNLIGTIAMAMTPKVMAAEKFRKAAKAQGAI